jgi:Transposase IS116/IS110/IS902 family
VWSGNTAGRVRMTRSGNRQLNAALHRIAVTQIRLHGPGPGPPPQLPPPRPKWVRRRCPGIPTGPPSNTHGRRAELDRKASYHQLPEAMPANLRCISIAAMLAASGGGGCGATPPIAIGSSLSARTVEFCSTGDPICAPEGLDRAAHSAYKVNGMADKAAVFAANALSAR